MYQSILVIAVVRDIFVLHQDYDTAMSHAKSCGHHEVVELLHGVSMEHQRKGTTLPYKVPMFMIQSHVLEKLYDFASFS